MSFCFEQENDDFEETHNIIINKRGEKILDLCDSSPSCSPMPKKRNQRNQKINQQNQHSTQLLSSQCKHVIDQINDESHSIVINDENTNSSFFGINNNKNNNKQQPNEGEWIMHYDKENYSKQRELFVKYFNYCRGSFLWLVYTSPGWFTSSTEIFKGPEEFRRYFVGQALFHYQQVMYYTNLLCEDNHH